MRRAIFCFLLLLTACNFQPANYPPCWEMPCTYRTGESLEASANIRWWEQFNEPILNALILCALKNNQNLKIATENVIQFFYQYAIQESNLYPLVQAEAIAERQQVPEGIVPEVFNQFELALTFSYMVDIWGRLRNLTDAALFLYLSEKEVRRTVILTLVSQVANAYFQLRTFDNQLEIAKQTLAIREKTFEISEIRFKEGLVSATEVKQTASEVDGAKIVIKQLEASIPIQENLISVLVGENPTCILRGRKLSELPLPPKVPAGLPVDLLTNRPDILAAEYVLYSFNAQVGAARALFFPAITLTGLYGGLSNEIGNVLSGSNRIWNITGNILQTIFDGGAIYSNLQFTESERREAINEYILAIQIALQEVDDALISHQKAKELYEVRTHRVKILEDYYILANLQYENGQVDYLTVVDAERTLFQVQLDQAQAEGDEFKTLVDIYAALGGGWVVDADCLSRR